MSEKSLRLHAAQFEENLSQAAEESPGQLLVRGARMSREQAITNTHTVLS